VDGLPVEGATDGGSHKPRRALRADSGKAYALSLVSERKAPAPLRTRELT
jgi:hypothetical protein